MNNTDFQDRVELHARVMIPDWLDTYPPVEEIQQVLAAHRAVQRAVDSSIRRLVNALMTCPNCGHNEI